MKCIHYEIMQEVNHGTVDEPNVVKCLRKVTLGPMTEQSFEVNYAMALKEAVGGEVTVEDVPEPPMTAEEVRAKRDKLLAETDWTQVADAPIDTATRTAMRVYRQQLRDITEQEGFPTDIVWPEMPTIVKATPEPIDEVVEAIIGVEVTE